MAFPVPSHLPRRPHPQDVSSQILAKIDQATNKTLTASVASSWLTELDETIHATKSQIHDRIHADLPTFEQQLESSKSVQTRLQSLSSNVDELSQTLSDPETGLIPTLIQSLTAHATLAQQSTDASLRHATLAQLLQCRTQFTSVTSLVQLGKLPQAVEACGKFEQLVEAAPTHLHQTNVMLDLKRKFQAAKFRTEEQLSDAYARSVVVSPKSLTISPSIVVRQSETVLSLQDTLSALSVTSLSNHLTTLRRDIITHYVDNVLRQPMSLTISSEDFGNQLTLFPSPPISEHLTTRLDNVSATLRFLSAHFVAFLPNSESAVFLRSLIKPTVNSVLSNLLIPSLPSSFDSLPEFIRLAKQAVAFEEDFMVQLLGGDQNDRSIKSWVDGMGGHYERQRRVQILEACRIIVLEPESAPPDRFQVEVDVPQDAMPAVVPVQAEDEEEDAWGFEDKKKSATHVADDGWGFNDEDEAEPEPALDLPPSTEDTEDSWGFDEEEEEQPPATNGHEKSEPDAWGLDDDVPAESTEEAAWDDPWDDEPRATLSINPRLSLEPTPASPASTSSPRMATRLEKLANKGKKPLNGGSPMSTPASPLVPAPPAQPTQPTIPPVKSPEKRPPHLPKPIAAPKETYLVSGRTRQIIKLVESVLSEGARFATSKILPPSETSLPPGTVLLQSAASTLDLYRALHPVKFADRLKSIPEAPMQFSNDCLYLSAELLRVENTVHADTLGPVKDRLEECRTRLKVLGDSWFNDTIEQHRQSANDIIAQRAQGFTYTGDQDRYDECENALSRVVQEIKRLAQRWKGVLAKSKYYTAIGMLTDTALSRVLEDVLALPDIPEVESHRLNELCRLLHPLEALFMEGTNPDSFVVAYVPSWLKFSYLSELLEASMVDISYLFDSGALVDFEASELVRLVRALFADTPLRTTTINKLTGGRS
ncbi:hypothetical protein FB45DRAFT_752778 [Roridomyces roridus]|uniref:Retrograde transport protein Dsl1 C-terminal domain-containing protein n=1 Tax=Roridomyces roridus TaxID=1738132 RepID=A0AAD7FIV6_9AGAR|nr:hypothetical protein FB45DRAFT_752778 [Roridomyces roridus]